MTVLHSEKIKIIDLLEKNNCRHLTNCVNCPLSKDLKICKNFSRMTLTKDSRKILVKILLDKY